ncbi:hypothetical protein WMY93_024147 [Mugilogobius chulae]|uniref:LRRNT domain-containing protein n=1 Tax=Mugilogobius chulae TaxID=88201 RepID=A0AAW0N6A4_9GOBI
MVPLSMCQSTGPAMGPSHPQNCPAVCSCTNQLSKVVCTRRGLVRVPPNIPTNTRYLNLMENSIETIQADTFRRLHHLEVLQLGRNAIRQIEVGAFNGLTSLNTLELFDNRLTVIPSGAFEYLSKLRELWLRNNPIESIPSNAFNRVPSLMRLDLGELRKLEYISDGAFDGLQNLKNAFDDNTALVELNLAHNNLSSLPHNLFTPLQYLVELHLHHNPWRCDCDVVWLSCGSENTSPPTPQGRYLVEVDQTTFQCSAPVILDAPRDLNISAERVAELKCRTAPMSSVRWLLPNGTVLTHGIYTCMVSNMAGNSNASAYLNVSNAELNTSNLSYFTTVTVEIMEPTVEETPKPKPTLPASPSVFQPVFISTPTVLFHNTQTPRQVSIPTAKIPITLLAAAMLIAFYKLRKRHQQRSTVAAVRTIEIIQMEEEVPPVPPTTSGSSGSDDTGLVLPTLVEHNSNTFKPGYVSSTRQGSYGAHWTHNNSLHRSVRQHHSHISTISDPYIIKTSHGKDKVQETQI